MTWKHHIDNDKYDILTGNGTNFLPGKEVIIFTACKKFQQLFDLHTSPPPSPPKHPSSVVLKSYQETYFHLLFIQGSNSPPPLPPPHDRQDSTLIVVSVAYTQEAGGGGVKPGTLFWIGSRQIKADNTLPARQLWKIKSTHYRFIMENWKYSRHIFFCPMLKSELHCSRIYFSFSWRSKKFYLGHISFGPFSRHFLLSKLNILKTATPGTNNMSSYLVTILYTD